MPEYLETKADKFTSRVAIPATPLGEMEAQVSELYRTRLPALYRTIRS